MVELFGGWFKGRVDLGVGWWIEALVYSLGGGMKRGRGVLSCWSGGFNGKGINGG